MKIRDQLKLMFSLDLRSLAIMRILLASVVIVDLIERARYLDLFYTDKGVLPREALFGLFSNKVYLSIYMAVGSSFGVKLFFVSAGIIAFGLLLGYRTRICTLLTWFLHLSLLIRNPNLLNGGDTYLTNVLLISIFLPWGEKWSLDAIGNQYKQDIKVFSIATIALILQVSCIYLFTGILKAGSPYWQQGSAIYYAFSLGEMTKPAAQWVLHYPDMMTILAKVIPYIDIALPGLFLISSYAGLFRLVALVAFILFHLTVLLTFHVALFSCVCIAVLIGLMPSIVWGDKTDHVRSVSCSSWRGAFIIFIMYCTIIANLKNANIKVYEPSWVKVFRESICLRQNWRMFVNPPEKAISVVLKGELNTGQEVVVFASSYKLKDEDSQNPVKDERFRKWLLSLAKANKKINKSKKEIRSPYWIKAACDSWNASHQELNMKVRKISLVREKRSNNTKNINAESREIILTQPCP